jgi:hypothetical protein
MAKPVPVIVVWETLTGPVPEFSNETVCEPLLPTGTLPKLMLWGLTVSVRDG